MLTTGFESHDHAACIAATLRCAEAYCEREGVRLTPARRRTLELLCGAHRALGAYDVLERLRTEGLGSHAPIAYRALDFLTSHGFAHRVERLDAWVACAHPGQAHCPAFMICRRCERVAETRAGPSGGTLGNAARGAGFRIERTVLEAEGLCPACDAAPVGGAAS